MPLGGPTPLAGQLARHRHQRVRDLHLLTWLALRQPWPQIILNLFQNLRGQNIRVNGRNVIALAALVTRLPRWNTL